MTDTSQRIDTKQSKTKTAFKEESLSVRDHMDPDKHWIGETLPGGSDAETRPSGIRTSAGSSPFPARADHSHDSKTYYSTYNGGAVYVPPGQTFINNLNLYSGRNMLAAGSNQVIIFPLEGIWEVMFNFHIDRIGGGIFQNELNILYWYTNGGTGRYVHRQSMFDLPTQYNGTVVDHCHYFDTNPANNVQIAIQHNDTANWYVYTNYLEVTRMHSSGSA